MKADSRKTVDKPARKQVPEAVEMEVAPLQECAVLLIVSLSCASFKKTDKVMAAAIAKTENADPELISGSKLLVVSENHRLLKKRIGQIRNGWMSERLIPWDDERNEKILVLPFMDEVKAQIKEDNEYLERHAQLLYDEWPDLLVAAQKRKTGLGSTYKAEDYPDRSELKDLFKMKTKFKMIPSSDDVRLRCSKKQLSEMKKIITADVEGQIAAAAEKVMERVMEDIGHLASALSSRKVDKEGKVLTTFRDNTLEKVQRLLADLPGLNITGNPALEAARVALVEKLDGQDASELREDNKACRKLGREVNSILKNLGGSLS